MQNGNRLIVKSRKVLQMLLDSALLRGLSEQHLGELLKG